MKLNKKSRDKIFDLHLGLTFDWRETGLLRWRIFLWMLFFGVCAFAAGLFVHVEVPEIRSRGDQPGAVVLLPADNPRLHQYVLRNTPLPVRGPVWADPVTAGPTGEMGVTLPSPRSADTPLAPLPPVSVPTVADQVWRMWQHPLRKPECHQTPFSAMRNHWRHSICRGRCRRRARGRSGCWCCYWMRQANLSVP